MGNSLVSSLCQVAQKKGRGQDENVEQGSLVASSQKSSHYQLLLCQNQNKHLARKLTFEEYRIRAENILFHGLRGTFSPHLLFLPPNHQWVWTWMFVI